MYLFRKKLITVVFELKLSGSLRLTLFSSVSVFWRRKGEERGWRVLGFKTPHSCLTWTRTTEHTDTGRHTPYVHFYPWSTISTAHDYIHVYPHLCNKTVEFYPWSHFKLPSCIGCIPYLQIHKIVQFTGCVRTCYFFFFFFFHIFWKMWKTCSEWAVMLTRTGRFLKKTCEISFYILTLAPKDVTHIEHPVTVVITAAFQQIKWSGFLMNSLGAIVATELNVWVIYFALRYCIYSEWIKIKGFDSVCLSVFV